MEIYSGYIKDKKKLLESSSGGAATVISEAIIERGGSVFGVQYSSDFRSAEYVCIDSKDELIRIKGSKYLETHKNFSQVADELQKNRVVLFFGVGCTVGALKAYCKQHEIESKNLYTVDILCHGPVTQQIHKKYIEDLERKYNSKVVSFSTRYKKNGWTPPYLQVKFENGKIYEELFEFTDLGFAFSRFSIPRCTNCKFKGENHCGDLCIGDCFGITESMRGWNKNGVSCIIIQTTKGRELVDMLSNNFELSAIDSNLVIKHNPMYDQSRKQAYDYEYFLINIKKLGLHDSLRKLRYYRSWSRRVKIIKIKRGIKSFLGYKKVQAIKRKSL